MGWFTRRKTERDSLIELIVQGEIERRKVEAELRQKERELELRKIEIEVQNAEILGDQRRKDLEFRAHLTEKRREAQRIGQAQRKARQREQQQVSCPVCLNPGDPHLTSDQITFHHMGHQGAPTGDLFPQ